MKNFFEPSGFYHVYNRTVAKNHLFLTSDDYLYFLQRYRKYTYRFAKTYAYCLLPNHFHFLIKIKDLNDLKDEFDFEEDDDINELIIRKFSNFYNGYVQVFNHHHDRKGTLLNPNFKSKLIEDDEYLLELIKYIHFNPYYHDLVEDFRLWKFSSYPALAHNYRTWIAKREVISFFHDRQNFKYCHDHPRKNVEINEFSDLDKQL